MPMVSVYSTRLQYFSSSIFFSICIIRENSWSKSFNKYEDAEENEDGTVPESVIQQTLPLSPQQQCTILDMQVTQSFPDSIAIFLASISDSIIPPSFPETITNNVLLPNH